MEKLISKIIFEEGVLELKHNVPVVDGRSNYSHATTYIELYSPDGDFLERTNGGKHVFLARVGSLVVNDGWHFIERQDK